MMKKLLLPVILGILTLGFWASSDFQEIAAGVAIFLFGMLMLEDGFELFGGGTLERVLKARQVRRQGRSPSGLSRQRCFSPARLSRSSPFPF